MKKAYLILLMAIIALTANDSILLADTVFMKKGEEVKGLVVEEHQDRILLSTADGEQSIMRSEIKSIEYDDPSYTFLSLGRQKEEQKKYAEALSYYRKAQKINPELSEAKQAAIGIKSKLWAEISAASQGEVSKRQDLEDAWREDTDIDEQLKKNQEEKAEVLWKRLGIKLKEKGDWIVLAEVRFGGDAFKRGFRKNDALESIDGMSLRYLSEEIVAQQLLEPRYANMTISIRRNVRFPKDLFKRKLKDLGFEIKQEYQGLIVGKVRKESLAYARKMGQNDMIVAVNGEKTRYMPKRKAIKLVEDKKNTPLIVTITKSITMARK